VGRYKQIATISVRSESVSADIIELRAEVCRIGRHAHVVGCEPTVFGRQPTCRWAADRAIDRLAYHRGNRDSLRASYSNKPAMELIV
jgi:hypothetical protein